MSLLQGEEPPKKQRAVRDGKKAAAQDGKKKAAAEEGLKRPQRVKAGGANKVCH